MRKTKFSQKQLHQFKRKEGVVILPLKEYERIKEDLEKRLAKEIEKARKEMRKGK